VDGIGVEDLWYIGTRRRRREETNERLEYLMKFKEAGKTVLVVDYVDDGSGYSGRNLRRIKDFIFKSKDMGFIPYAARSDRELDEMVVIEGIQPQEIDQEVLN
jgi:cysteinyl-tRNA synthetase